MAAIRALVLTILKLTFFSGDVDLGGAKIRGDVKMCA